MKGFTRHRFSPWVPLVIWIALAPVVVDSTPSHSGGGLISDVSLAWILITLLVWFLLVLSVRTLIEVRQSGVTWNLVLSLDFLSLYVPSAVFFFVASGGYGDSGGSGLLALLSALLALATSYRLFPHPFHLLSDFLIKIMGLFTEVEGVTRHRFSPWIPLVILAVLLPGAAELTPQQVEGERVSNVYLSVLLITLMVWFVFVLSVRTIIKVRQDGVTWDLIFSRDFLSLYVFSTVFSFIQWGPYRGSASWGQLALLSAVLALAASYRLFPHPFHTLPGVLIKIVCVFLGLGGGASVSRPDVLSEPSNVDNVKNTLPLQENSIFCGEVRSAGPPESRQPVYVSAEDRGIVIGPPGTGKTAFMVTQLLDLAERRGSFVCLDIKPELHRIMREKLAAQGYRILVFNPTDKADRYNLLDDLSGPTAIGELAYSLIPSDNSNNRAFDEGARDLLDGIISYLRYEKRAVSLPALRAFLAQFSSETELIATLAQCDDLDVKDTAFAIARSAKNARFMGSVFATLRSNLRFLRVENIRDSIECSDFSLSLFKEEQPVALFLQFEERHQETTQLLLAAMVSHLFNYFIEHVDRQPVLLMLDEIGNVPRIPGLVEKLNTIRSRKLPTWLYWQGIQQMQKYGKQANEGPNSIMAACDFHMAFRLNDNDSARWFSERIGTVDRRAVSVSDGGGFRGSTTVQMKEEPVLKIADLQALPFGEGIAIYRGKVWRNWATPYFERWPEMAREKPVLEVEAEGDSDGEWLR